MKSKRYIFKNAQDSDYYHIAMGRSKKFEIIATLFIDDLSYLFPSVDISKVTTELEEIKNLNEVIL